MTLSLLLMAKKMARHKVLVKNLTTLETLSCVNVIASDKTGTLTQNKMFVSSVLAGNTELDLHSNYDAESSAFRQLVSVAALCNNASFMDEENPLNVVPICQRSAKGDATDIALLKFAAEHIENVEETRSKYQVMLDIPFNSRNKWMMKTLQSKGSAESHTSVMQTNNLNINNISVSNANSMHYIPKIYKI